MRYFVMESAKKIILPNSPKPDETIDIVTIPNIDGFSEIDYDANSGLISERLKLLMGLYMPKYVFTPFIYVEDIVPGKPLSEKIKGLQENLFDVIRVEGDDSDVAKSKENQDLQELVTNSVKLIAFWKFAPDVYGVNAVFRADGIVSHITFNNNNIPLIFTVLSPRKERSVVVNLAVAESIFRRKILGLKLTGLSEV